MIRIHVLLLASLLSIWGLTSCENSDTDKVNSYNLEVNLSQNEITAINGIISICKYSAWILLCKYYRL